MKRVDKIIKIVYTLIPIIVMIVGLGFSYLIAVLEDAPGMVFIGTTISLAGASTIYGIGEIIIQQRKNNAILMEINNELGNKTD